jgi:hypothetical protein
LADPAGTDPLAAQPYFRHFVGEKPQPCAGCPEEINIAFTIMAKGEAAAEIDLFRVKSLGHYIPQKLLSADLRKIHVELDYDRLLDAQNAKRLDLLVEGLQKGRRRLWVEHCPGMRIESDYSGHCTHCPGTFDHCPHNQLVTEVQPVKNAEC